MKYLGDRIMATAYPVIAPAYDRFGQYVDSHTHRALATATLDPEAAIGPVAALSIGKDSMTGFNRRKSL